MADVQRKPRGRPFSATNQPGRGPRPDAPAEQDFGQLARRILTDPKAQRALLRRAQRGDLPSATVKMLSAVAAPAPEPTAAERAAPTPGELAAYLEASVPPFIQRLMYDHAKGRLDDRGNPTPLAAGTGARRLGPGKARKAAPARKAEAPPEEPDLEPDQPLAAARDRLEAEAREARDRERSVAVEVDLSAIPDPPPTREELLARGRAPRVEHDHRDRDHRAECRRCRAAWRSEGADPARIQR